MGHCFVFFEQGNRGLWLISYERERDFAMENDDGFYQKNGYYSFVVETFYFISILSLSKCFRYVDTVRCDASRRAHGVFVSDDANRISTSMKDAISFALATSVGEKTMALVFGLTLCCCPGSFIPIPSFNGQCNHQ